jgi:hypothetical protein
MKRYSRWRTVAISSLILALSVASTARPVATPDHSLNLKQYRDLGFPAIDKAWTGADYAKACKVLDDLARKDPTKLPRYHSGTSGAVFDRMVAPDNLPSLSNHSTGAERMGVARDIMGGVVPAFTAYAKVSQAQATFDAEELKLGLFLLRGETCAALISADMLKSDPKIAQDQKRMGGIAKIKEGLAQSACGLIIVLTDHDSIRDAEALRAIGELKQVLGKAYPLLDSAGRKDIMEKLTGAIKAESVPARKAALQDLHKALTP